MRRQSWSVAIPPATSQQNGHTDGQTYPSIAHPHRIVSFTVMMHHIMSWIMYESQSNLVLCYTYDFNKFGLYQIVSVCYLFAAFSRDLLPYYHFP